MYWFIQGCLNVRNQKMCWKAIQQNSSKHDCDSINYLCFQQLLLVSSHVIQMNFEIVYICEKNFQYLPKGRITILSWILILNISKYYFSVLLFCNAEINEINFHRSVSFVSFHCCKMISYVKLKTMHFLLMTMRYSRFYWYLILPHDRCSSCVTCSKDVYC